MRWILWSIVPWLILPAASQSPAASSRYIQRVNRALAAKRDVWGEQMLRAPDGPTLAVALRYLHPLFLQFHWYGPSGVYYLPFGMEDRPTGGSDFVLHYADGSAIVTRWAQVPPAAIPKCALRSAGERITFFVGPRGRERYGRDLARLQTPELRKGFLPILITHYVDRVGNHYREESFATRLAGTESLLSFVHFSLQHRERRGLPIELRIHFSRVNRQAKKLEAMTGLAARNGRVLDAEGRVYLLFSPGAHWRGADLVYRFNRQRANVWLVRLNNPGAIRSARADRHSYRRARAQVAAYWRAKLESGAQILVPERYAMDAERNLLIQNLLMNVRYSIGNPYETVFNSESHFSIQALGDYGYLAEYRAGLAAMLKSDRRPGQYEMGERLLHAADYYFLTRDTAFLRAHDATYRAYVAELRTQMARNNGLLDRVPTDTDIAGPTLHFNMHQQAVAWRGLLEMAAAWRLSGEEANSRQAASAAAVLGRALRRAIRVSSTWLPDGSLFVPVHLLEPKKVQPYDPITATSQGAYWLLVATDGFATGILNHQQDMGVLKYLYNHGAGLLGMIRFNYSGEAVGSCNAKGLPGYATPGVDNAYLPSYLEFLAENDQADRLVLSFYGKLAQGMTRNTFIAGEGDSVGVCQAAHMANATPDQYYRTMYLPPNSTNNASYLLALRWMLVQDRLGAKGQPAGLDLGFATPRPWLGDGRQIVVRGVPTFFGPITYTLTSNLARERVTAQLAIPSRNPIPSLKLQLRVPGNQGLIAVRVNGRVWGRFIPAGTIDLSGLRGEVRLIARFRPIPQVGNRHLGTH